MAFPEQFQGITVYGLYNDQTGDALYGVIGTTAPASALYIAGKDTVSGDLEPISLTNGNINVNATISPPSDNVTTGTLNTTPQTLVVSTEGTSALMLELVIGLNGLASGDTINFQVSLDGTTWQSANLIPVPTIGGQESNPFVSSVTGPQSNVTLNYTLPVGGIQQFRVSTSGTWTASSVAVTETAGQGQYGVFNYSLNQANFLATTYQGGAWTVAATQSGTWTVEQGGAPWSQNLTEVAGVALGATAVTAFGTAPAAANVPGVNASLFSGTTALTNTAGALNVNVSNTSISVTQGTSPWVDNVTEWASTALGAPTAWGTAPTGNVIGVNSELFAGNTAITATGSSLNVNLTGSSGGAITVAGTLTNNNAAPAADNVGVLPAIATGTTPQTYTSGNQVLPAVSVGGSSIVIPADEHYASQLSYYELSTANTYVAVTSTFTPVLAWETNSASYSYLIRMFQFFSSGTVIEFVVLKNPTVTGGSFVAASGHLNYNTTATSYSGGTKVLGGYAATVPFFMDQLLDAMAGGAPGDIFAVEARSFSGSGNVAVAMRWSEQTVAL